MVSVLYIEDDDANVELIRRYVSVMDNCNFTNAKDGGSGITTAVEIQPDIILLDIYLPDIDGLDVVDQLKSIPAIAHIPIVVITTDDSPELRAECLAHDCAAVLHKPIRPQHLLNIIEEMTA